MKKIITIFLLLITAEARSQYVFEANEKLGLKNANGKVLLPAEYDSIIRFVEFEKETDFYMVYSGFRSGFYHAVSGFNSGCVYDQVYAARGILTLRSKDRFGFVAVDTAGQLKIIEPQYHELFPMGDYPYSHDTRLDLHLRQHQPLSVRKDSLWGVISGEDGRVLVPCKHRLQVTKFESREFWFVIDSYAQTEICINPATGAEFSAPLPSREVLSSDSTRIMIFDYCDYKDGNAKKQVRVWDFRTGTLLFQYETYAAYISAKFQAADIISVTEEVRNEKTWSMESKRFAFHNLSNGATLFTYNGTGDDHMKVQVADNRLHVEIWRWKMHDKKIAEKDILLL